MTDPRDLHRELKSTAMAAVRVESARESSRSHPVLLTPAVILLLLVVAGILLFLVVIAGLVYLLYQATQETKLQNSLAVVDAIIAAGSHR